LKFSDEMLLLMLCVTAECGSTTINPGRRAVPWWGCQGSCWLGTSLPRFHWLWSTDCWGVVLSSVTIDTSTASVVIILSCYLVIGSTLVPLLW